MGSEGGWVGLAYWHGNFEDFSILVRQEPVPGREVKKQKRLLVV